MGRYRDSTTGRTPGRAVTTLCALRPDAGRRPAPRSASLRLAPLFGPVSPKQAGADSNVSDPIRMKGERDRHYLRDVYIFLKVVIEPSARREGGPTARQGGSRFLRVSYCYPMLILLLSS